MTRSSNQELLDFALGLATTAEAEILPRYQRCSVDLKADGTEVTEADREAERVVRQAIEARYPDHGILGEEMGTSRHEDARQQWIVDPIDGTASFTLGLPLFGTLIGYLEDGEPEVGVIHMPALGETVYAARGLGCWLRRGSGEPTPVRVAEPVPLSDAVVGATGVHGTEVQRAGVERPVRLAALVERVRKLRFCGDCVQHAMLCKGVLHAAVDTIMNPWDVAALIPCIEEAGGVASTLDGRRDDIVFGGSLVTSCHPSVHDQVLATLTS